MLKPISSRDKKNLFELLKNQFGFSGKLDYNFFTNDKKRIFLFNKNLEINFSKIRINSLGLYFANTEKEIRLTIEGSQIIGPYSKKNILKLNDKDLESWIYGNDIKTKEVFEGFILIKNNDDFYGTGKYKDGIILNFLPKERRLKS